MQMVAYVIDKRMIIMKRKQIEQRIFSNIFLLSNQLQAEGDKLTQELTLKQWFFLLYLFKSKMEAPSVNNLAEAMGITRQSLKKMVSLLEEKDFITVKKSSIDSRALSIHPTQKAYDFFQENKTVGNILLDSVFEGITEEELIIVTKVLDQLLNNLAANKDRRTNGQK